MDAAHHQRHEVDRRYRAKVAIMLVAGCVALWIGLGWLALHTL